MFGILSRIHDLLFVRDAEPWNGSQHSPNSDRSLAVTRDTVMIQGNLVAINIQILSGTLRDGQCHVRVVLETSDNKEEHTLCMGYVYPGHEVFGVGSIPFRKGDRIRLESRGSQTSIVLRPTGKMVSGQPKLGGWGGVFEGSLSGFGNVRSIAGTDPAAGLEISETVPTNARWRLKVLRGALVTTANTGDREPHLRLTDGTNDIFYLPAGASQTASLTRNYQWSNIGAQVDAAVSTERAKIMVESLQILQAYTVGTTTSNIQANDNWGAPRLLVEEWIEE